MPHAVDATPADEAVPLAQDPPQAQAQTRTSHDDAKDTPPGEDTNTNTTDNKTESTVVRVTPSTKTESQKTLADSFIPINRGRVVSEDRGRELIHAEQVDSDHSSDTTTRNDRHKSSTRNNAADSSLEENDDNCSSGSNTSDGESSYFAKHLPSPKSGRNFAFSSAASTSSAPASSGNHIESSNAHRESDASLSFSDDDDDWNESSNNVATSSRQSPMISPPLHNKPPVTTSGEEHWQNYPQRITRMHSVSSLVSTSSGDEAQAEGKLGNSADNPMALSGSAASSDISLGTSTSDPSVRSELRDVASSKGWPPSSESGETPSGRKSPIPPPEAEFSNPNNDLVGRMFVGGSTHPHASPPLLVHGYAPFDAHGVAHPQPLPSEHHQMAPPWMPHGGGVQAHFMPPPPQIYYPSVRYGATSTTAMMGPPRYGPYAPEYFSAPPPIGTRYAVQSEVSRSTVDSNTTLPLVYSDDDDETEDSARFVNSLGTGRRKPSKRGEKSRGFDSTTDPIEPYDRLKGDEATGAGKNHGIQSKTRQRASHSKSLDPAGAHAEGNHASADDKGFRVYWQRWMMLAYMSILNLMSDWTCYSVAPISILTNQAFGRVNPELLVVVFLGANAVATACEPILLSRLGLRRTVVFGALLLMLGSMVKSGGLPPVLQSSLVKGKDEWRIYFGFFLVGLSQPLYQCTPALLSASWFPEKERTMATGVALNANQLGIGCAFIFGTLLVADSDDIPKYFGLLSIISTITFAGCLIQFEDAPPTPPSETARIIRGTLELPFSGVGDMIWSSVRSLGDNNPLAARVMPRHGERQSTTAAEESARARDGRDARQSGTSKSNDFVGSDQKKSSRRSHGGASGSRRRGGDSTKGSRRSSRSSSSRKSSSKSGTDSLSNNAQAPRPAGAGASGIPSGPSGGTTRRRSGSTSRPLPATSDQGFRAGNPSKASGPSPSLLGDVDQAARDAATAFDREEPVDTYSPSPMMPGRVGPMPPQDDSSSPHRAFPNDPQPPFGEHGMRFPSPHQGAYRDPMIPSNAYWQQPGWNMYPNPQQGQYYYPGNAYYYPQMYPHPQSQYNEAARSSWLSTGTIDDGAEPVLTLTPHNLDINIRDDQIILSIRACFSRPGFIHALVSFTVSGIVINTLSTFMDYLVRLNGAGREYVGIVGGSFQIVIMISSLIVGKQTDKTRAYYSVTVGMLVLGAFGLAECGVSLDADRGTELRWALVVVAALVGPLQPVSTELGVDVAYPLSENTVLVIQQLFSNLLSALFIPFFKAVRDVGTETVENGETLERPQYTFSFYLLIVLHATATVFFATFNGRYLRYEHEQEKKMRAEQSKLGLGTAFSPVQGEYSGNEIGDGTFQAEDEHQPLITRVV